MDNIIKKIYPSTLPYPSFGLIIADPPQQGHSDFRTWAKRPLVPYECAYLYSTQYTSAKLSTVMSQILITKKMWPNLPFESF